jgi:hypothetical protein
MPRRLSRASVSIEKYASCSDGYYSEPLSMSAGITDKRAPIFLNMKCPILRAAHAKYVGCLDNDGRKRSEGVIT